MEKAVAELDGENVLDNEWLFLSAIRDARRLAERKPSTYAEALDWIAELAPEIIRTTSPLLSLHDSHLKRLYLARAIAQSASKGIKVKPLQLVEDDISALRSESQAKLDSEHKRTLGRQLRRLHKVHSMFSIEDIKQSWTETESIWNDATSGGTGLQLPMSNQGRGYKEFRLGPRVIRAQVLHPDPREWKTGVDLIYEYYDCRATLFGQEAYRARIVALQYKRWDGSRLKVPEESREHRQLRKARKSFCSSGLCQASDTPNHGFRFPFCSAFLRPTDRIQTTNGFQVTSAKHIPICQVQRILSSPKNKLVLTSDNLKDCAISHTIFAEGSVSGFLGSRWIDTADLEQIYDRIGLDTRPQVPVCHFQEFEHFT